MDNKQLIIFTDGACKNNGKKNARAGIGIHFPNKELKDISEKFTLSPITNQRAELWAVHRAITTIVNSGIINKYNKVIIYSDSKYTIKSLTVWPKIWTKNGWKSSSGKNVMNTDIIIPLYELIQNYENKIKFIHVIAHTERDDPISNGNRIADLLANENV
jgi:ribonuclease HI